MIESNSARETYRTRGRGKITLGCAVICIVNIETMKELSSCGAAAFCVMRHIEQEEIRKKEKSNL